MSGVGITGYSAVLHCLENIGIIWKKKRCKGLFLLAKSQLFLLRYLGYFSRLLCNVIY